MEKPKTLEQLRAEKAYTFYFIPRNALVPEIITDAKERVGYYGISTAFFMGSSSFMYAATLFVNILKNMGLAPLAAWRVVFLVFAAIGMTCVMLTACCNQHFATGYVIRYYSGRQLEKRSKQGRNIFRNQNIY